MFDFDNEFTATEANGVSLNFAHEPITSASGSEPPALNQSSEIPMSEINQMNLYSRLAMVEQRLKENQEQNSKTFDQV